MITLTDIKNNPKMRQFFISKSKGGLNPCIVVANQKDNNGVVDSELDVLGNCTAFSTGMFNFSAGLNECKYLGNHNAKNYVEIAKSQGLEISTVPVAGGVNVWDDGKCGHVEYVDSVSADGKISYDLSSGYASYVFAQRTRKRDTGGSGQWGFKKPSKFLGCVMPPKKAETKTETPDETQTDDDDPYIYCELGGKKYRFVLEEVNE